TTGLIDRCKGGGGLVLDSRLMNVYGGATCLDLRNWPSPEIVEGAAGKCAFNNPASGRRLVCCPSAIARFRAGSIIDCKGSAPCPGGRVRPGVAKIHPLTALPDQAVINDDPPKADRRLNGNCRVFQHGAVCYAQGAQ